VIRDWPATAKGREGRAAIERRTDEPAVPPSRRRARAKQPAIPGWSTRSWRPALPTGLFPPNTTPGHRQGSQFLGNDRSV
jgi:hypothetical protein